MEVKRTVYEVTDGVASILMNNPKTMNAFDDAMVDDVFSCLKMAEEDPQARAIVVTGAGKAFCGGGDIAYMYQGLKNNTLSFDTGIERIARLAQYMKQLPKPIIVGVHNAVAGAGFNFALAGDFCVAAKGTRFLQAFVNIGLVPDTGGAYLLSRAVGANRAAHYALTGQPIDAEEAQRVGIVYQICEPEELAACIAKLAARLAKGPAVAYANIKKMIYESSYQDLDSYIPKEAAAQLECSGTEDFREGVYAFVEKRKPEYKGK